jgi:alpha-L-arabinofuranosidase
VKGHAIQCYLDDKLITEAEEMAGPQPEPIYVSASGSPSSGEVFLQVVNITAAPRQIDVNLKGVTKVAGDAACQVLAGDPSDVNSIAEPERVAPKMTLLQGVGPTFTHEFPAHSVTVMRLKAK